MKMIMEQLLKKTAFVKRLLNEAEMMERELLCMDKKLSENKGHLEYQVQVFKQKEKMYESQLSDQRDIINKLREFVPVGINIEDILP